MTGTAEAAPQGLAGALLCWWKARTQPAPRQLRLIETLSLGPKKSVALIDMNGQRFLAGMGADGVNTLLRLGTAAAAIEDSSR